MTLQLVDRWTTQDGSWEVDIAKPYGIDLLHAVEYVSEDIPGKGGATHIFVKAPYGSVVHFDTFVGDQDTTYTAGASGWVNHPMSGSSAYKVSRGEQGPWIVWVDGVRVVEGVGLPDGEHVSTFLVVEDRIAGSTPTPGKDQYKVTKNGTVVAAWES